MTRRSKEREQAAIRARILGKTMEETAKAAGVDRSTLWRWEQIDAAHKRIMELAGQLGARKLSQERLAKVLADEGKRPPGVEIREQCLQCGAPSETRTAHGRIKFWRCSRYPVCTWTSWRPPAPGVCLKCQSPQWFWSHSRLSRSCHACGHREQAK